MTDRERLIACLEEIASSLERPGLTAGMVITVTGGGVGNYVSVRDGGVGQVISTSGGSGGDSSKIVSELREAAEALKADKAPKAWIESLIGRLGNIGGRVVDFTLILTAQTLIKSVFG